MYTLETLTDKKSCDAEQQEITPAMIEAGERELRGIDPDYDDMAERAARVFLAMAKAKVGRGEQCA